MKRYWPWLGIGILLLIAALILIDNLNNQKKNGPEADELGSVTGVKEIKLRLADGTFIFLRKGSFLMQAFEFGLDQKSKKKTDLEMEGVRFNPETTLLKGNSEYQLQQLSRILANYRNIRIHIAVQPDTNLDIKKRSWLAQQRALVIKKYLMDSGIRADRVTTMSTGDEIDGLMEHPLISLIKD